jgi:uncharacterized protein (DUF3084 family)
MKIKYIKDMPLLVIFFLLCTMLNASIVVAEERIEELQQRANFAYEQMMEAKDKAEMVNMEKTDAEKALQRVKKSLERAEQEAEIARKKSQAADSALKQAQQQWNEASDALATEWRRSKNN